MNRNYATEEKENGKIILCALIHGEDLQAWFLPLSFCTTGLGF